MPMTIESGKGDKPSRFVIRDAMIVTGRGTPAEGPVDLVIENGVITQVLKVDEVSLHRYPEGWQRPQADRVIDAKGMYVLPGLVDSHTHVPAAPAGPLPYDWEYAYKLWLGHGVTTIRVVGGAEEILYDHRKMASSDPELGIPRLVINHRFPRTGGFTPDQARAKVAEFREMGADGIKLGETDPRIIEAICDEVDKQGMRSGVAIHLALNSEIDAVMASNAGVRTIEHTYGIPEAAIPGAQNFPPRYNEMDELDRFRQSGLNWPEAEQYPERVLKVLDVMLDNGTVWTPTMVVYEPNRDLMRAQNQAWFRGYATPDYLKFWSPTPGVHASFHFDWRTSDDINWKQKYRIWMHYLKAFFDAGGTITAGSDAGYLYTLYGFSMIRELELLQEVGFHPLDVVRMATTNGAEVLGLDELAVGLRPGAPADLAIVDGNPLENFKLMYGMGVERFLEDRVTKVKGGGVRWTVRDGVIFDAQGLLQEVEDYVKELKKAGPQT